MNLLPHFHPQPQPPPSTSQKVVISPQASRSHHGELILHTYHLPATHTRPDSTPNRRKALLASRATGHQHRHASSRSPSCTNKCSTIPKPQQESSSASATSAAPGKASLKTARHSNDAFSSFLLQAMTSSRKTAGDPPAESTTCSSQAGR